MWLPLIILKKGIFNSLLGIFISAFSANIGIANYVHVEKKKKL